MAQNRRVTDTKNSPKMLFLNTLRDGGADREYPTPPPRVRRTINPQTPNTNPNPKRKRRRTNRGLAEREVDVVGAMYFPVAPGVYPEIGYYGSRNSRRVPGVYGDDFG